MNTLSERLANFPEPWKPTTAGETLIGETTDLDWRESEYGDPYPIVTVCSDEDGKEYAWHAYHTMARNEVAKKKPQIGERVGILYGGIGEAEPGKNAPVKWRLIVERKPVEIDYSAVPTTPDPEPADTADTDIPF
jgi:hypothetical protein